MFCLPMQRREVIIGNTHRKDMRLRLRLVVGVGVAILACVACVVIIKDVCTQCSGMDSKIGAKSGKKGGEKGKRKREKQI
jgi:hypothetical protein